jgi:hypothetical protein
MGSGRTRRLFACPDRALPNGFGVRPERRSGLSRSGPNGLAIGQLIFGHWRIPGMDIERTNECDRSVNEICSNNTSLARVTRLAALRGALLIGLPIPRRIEAIGRGEPLRHDALNANLAGLLEDRGAVLSGVLAQHDPEAPLAYEPRQPLLAVARWHCKVGLASFASAFRRNAKPLGAWFEAHSSRAVALTLFLKTIAEHCVADHADLPGRPSATGARRCS